MIRYIEQSVFDAHCQALVNTINTQGVMGAGLALECRLLYPDMFIDYVARCQRQEVRIGQPYRFDVAGGPSVINFPTKAHWKFAARLDWIARGLQQFTQAMQTWQLESVAFPLLGCSRGGLRWEEVQPLMVQYLEPLAADVVICMDRVPAITGREARMVDYINNVSLTELGANGVKKAIAQKIQAALPIHRFRDLTTVQGVGQQSYEALFKLALGATRMKTSGIKIEQMSLNLGL